MKHVEIRVQGQIDQQWSEWFGNLTIMAVGHEQSLLNGIATYLAALYGILTKLRGLSLALISVSVDADAIEGVDDFKQKGETPFSSAWLAPPRAFGATWRITAGTSIAARGTREQS